MDASVMTRTSPLSGLGALNARWPLLRSSQDWAIAWRISILCIIGSLVALPCDLGLSQFAQQLRLNAELHQLLLISESFSHGLGVLVVLVTCGVLLPERRRSITLVAAMAYSAGGLADLLKLSIHRLRPSVIDHVTSVLDTFVGIGLHSPAGNTLHAYTHQSFPSAHTATAFGLACGLAWMFGRARGYFLLLATVASLQRIACGAHFPSDVLCGAAVGTLVAGIWLRLHGHRLQATP